MQVVSDSAELFRHVSAEKPEFYRCIMDVFAAARRLRMPSRRSRQRCISAGLHGVKPDGASLLRPYRSSSSSLRPHVGLFHHDPFTFCPAARDAPLRILLLNGAAGVSQQQIRHAIDRLRRSRNVGQARNARGQISVEHGTQSVKVDVPLLSRQQDRHGSARSRCSPAGRAQPWTRRSYRQQHQVRREAASPRFHTTPQFGHGLHAGPIWQW